MTIDEFARLREKMGEEEYFRITEILSHQTGQTRTYGRFWNSNSCYLGDYKMRPSTLVNYKNIISTSLDEGADRGPDCNLYNDPVEYPLRACKSA